jgi:hypothetical protein
VSEVGLRLRHGRIEEITGFAPWRVDRHLDLHYHWDRYDRQLGWTNLPGYRSDERVPFQVTINRRGLRAAGSIEYATRPAPGTTRVLVFGDSMTFGEEVDDDATLPHWLESSLADAEVLNFGVRGYGLGQMVLRLEAEGLAMHPDHVVLVILLPSDIARDGIAHFGHPKPVFRAEGERLVVSNVPVPEASRQSWLLRTSYAAAWLWGRPAEELPRRPGDLDAQLATTRLLLARAREACARAEAQLTAVPIVAAGTVERMRRVDGVRRTVERMSAAICEAVPRCIDARPFLADALAAHGARIVAPRGHWSAEGNCLLAQFLAAQLGGERGGTAQLASARPDCLDRLR